MNGSWLIVSAMVVFLAIIAVLFFSLSFYKKLHKANVRRLEQLEKERLYVESVLDSEQNEQVNLLLRHRASLISRLIAAEISGDSEINQSVMTEIGSLIAERDEFMRQNRVLIERWQPDLVARLRDNGLNEEEIEICCLYAMGLNGKTIQQYTQDSRHYQNVGLIRKKLGLGEHDKNIDGYIKSLMK